MLQRPCPEDFVIATGHSCSVRDFLDEAAHQLGMNWERHVKIDPRYFRPAEVDFLQGDATKARSLLGWVPKAGFKELISMMIDHDLELAKQEAILISAGHTVR